MQVAAGKGAAQEWVGGSSYEDVSVIKGEEHPLWISSRWIPTEKLWLLKPGEAGFLIRHRSCWGPPSPSFCPRGISFPLSRDPSLGKGQKEDFLRREREGGRMWSGGTLLRLPIAVKSTDINIHSLSIPHPRLILAGANSSNSGILAPFSLSFFREVFCPRKD